MTEKQNTNTTARLYPAPSSAPPRALAALRCPTCGSSFTHLGQQKLEESATPDPPHRKTTPRRGPQGILCCSQGHRYDLSKYGYVNFLSGKPNRSTPDTAGMVAARERFLAAGHYSPLRSALAEEARKGEQARKAGRARESENRKAGSPLLLEAGCGTGYYLAGALEALPDAPALAVDLSGYALRRAARLSGTLAMVWDLWRPLPITTQSVSTVLVVFAPRPLAEYHRILQPGGTLLLVSPGPGHLSGLPALAGKLSQQTGKQEKLNAELRPWFSTDAERTIRKPLRLTSQEVLDAMEMGPSGHHLDSAQAAAQLAAQQHWETVLDVTIRVLRPRPGAPLPSSAAPVPGETVPREISTLEI